MLQVTAKMTGKTVAKKKGILYDLSPNFTSNIKRINLTAIPTEIISEAMEVN